MPGSVISHQHTARRRGPAGPDKPNDLGDFLLEQWVVRYLEPARDMRLQSRRRPDASHTRRRDPHRFGHHRAAPVGGVGRSPPHGLRDHRQPCLLGQRGHPRGPGLIPQQPCHTLIKIAGLPTPHGGLGRLCALHNLVGAVAIGCSQDNLGPPDYLARRVSVSEQGLKPRSIGKAKVKVKANVVSSHPPNMPHSTTGRNLPLGGEH